MPKKPTIPPAIVKRVEQSTPPPKKEHPRSHPDDYIKVNGMMFAQNPGVDYRYDYIQIFKNAHDGYYEKEAGEVIGDLLVQDLFAFVFFGMKVPIVNNAWWVESCKLVDWGPKSHTLDLWFRGSGKSTIVTIAETMRDVLADPETRVGIFSYARGPALSFLNSIKQTFEQSDFLKWCFRSKLWADPAKDSPNWGLANGITIRREGNPKEATIQAHGLLEGMPTGCHFPIRKYDDIMTFDMKDSPAMIQDCKEKFDMSHNLGTGAETDRIRILGTPYHNEDVLQYIESKKKRDGSGLYTTRKRAATVDGTINGESVYLSEDKLDELRSTNLQMFYSQQLIDPTPPGDMNLDPDYLRIIKQDMLPKRLFRFISIDPAGSGRADGRVGDSWAVICFGIEPYRDQIGASNFYILDAFVEPCKADMAYDEIVAMYERNGRILCVGVEQVGLGGIEVHVANALRAKGKHISIDSGTLKRLSPGGRRKTKRIQDNLNWPLKNGKIHICDSVSHAMRERLIVEMRKFPFSEHDDMLDALAYGYDMIKDYRFGTHPGEPEEEKRDVWKRWKQRNSGKGSPTGWMSV